MPVRIRIIHGQRLVLLEAEGTLLPQELVDARHEIRRHPEFEPTFCLLADVRKVSAMNLPAAFIRDRAKSVFFRAPGRQAVVVERAVFYGLTRLYSAHQSGDGAETRPFYDMDEARRWLGLGEE